MAHLTTHIGIVGIGMALLGATAAPPAEAQAPPVTLTIQTDHPGAAISPTLNGLFFEDINFAADGGLNPERVKNGSFEFSPDQVAGWRKVERDGVNGSIAVLGDRPLNGDNPHFLRLTVVDPGGGLGLDNEGFRGMGVTRGAKFTFSVEARNVPGNGPLGVDVELLDSADHPIGSGHLSGFTGEWARYACDIQSAATDGHAHLVVLGKGSGAVDLDMVSLYPLDTWQHRSHGLRPDLVQLLRDLKPKFLRFPGGCIVEGRYLTTRYQWKTTIGDLDQRRPIVNRWNDEFHHRPTPDYFQSFGIGFFEYFQLCEDIGAKPLPILNCGMACQYNTGELQPLDQLQPYVQDALDLIEFANGPATTPWGARRATMGHPAPFGLDRIGVGNEQWGPRYFERYERFATALKAAHPEVKLVAAAGPSPNGPLFTYAWDHLRALGADVVDEHYYANPDWFLANAHRYDKYDRNGPRVFAGEFAAQSVGIASPANRNDWRCALAEAAFMTGLERNGDVVVMASYAPLLAHVDAWQWTPDLIWFDNLRSYGTPSYYVQKLFSVNAGSTVLPATMDGPSDGLYLSATRDDATGDVVLKLVNAQPVDRAVTIDLAGVVSAPTGGEVTVMASDDLAAENSIAQPTKVSPVASPLDGIGSRFTRTVGRSSVMVMRIHVKR